MAGSIEAFAFSDGTAKFRANNTLVVEEQPTSPATTECRLTGPLVFRDALTAWAALLYTLLSGNKLAGSARAPYLRQLLLRLNFNNFFLGAARALATAAPARAT